VLGRGPLHSLGQLGRAGVAVAHAQGGRAQGGGGGLRLLRGGIAQGPADQQIKVLQRDELTHGPDRGQAHLLVGILQGPTHGRLCRGDAPGAGQLQQDGLGLRVRAGEPVQDRLVGVGAGERLQALFGRLGHLPLAEGGIQEHAHGRGVAQAGQHHDGRLAHGRRRALGRGHHGRHGCPVLAVAEGPQQQRLPLRRERGQGVGQCGRDLRAGHLAGQRQPEVELALVARRAEQLQHHILRFAAGEPGLPIQGARLDVLRHVGRTDRLEEGDRLGFFAGVSQALGAGQARVAQAVLHRGVLGEGLFQHGGGLGRADPAQGPGRGRRNRRLTVGQQPFEQIDRLAVLALADRVDHSHELATLELRGCLAQGVVHGWIRDGLQAEAGVEIELLVAQQRRQGGNRLPRAHHGQALARLGLVEHRRAGVLEDFDQLVRRQGHDLLRVGLPVRGRQTRRWDGQQTQTTAKCKMQNAKCKSRARWGTRTSRVPRPTLAALGMHQTPVHLQILLCVYR